MSHKEEDICLFNSALTVFDIMKLVQNYYDGIHIGLTVQYEKQT